MARETKDWIHYYESVRKYQLHLSEGVEDLAEDLTQETFLRLHRWGGEEKNSRNPKAYIRRIARNVASDHYRKRNQTEELEVKNGQVLNEAVDPLDAALIQDDYRHLNEQIEELHMTDQRMIRGLYWEGRGCAEIADRVGMSLSGVKGRLYRARIKLRSVLPVQE